jgi:hypothetical protein
MAKASVGYLLAVFLGVLVLGTVFKSVAGFSDYPAFGPRGGWGPTNCPMNRGPNGCPRCRGTSY